jgi:hypothetical protein
MHLLRIKTEKQAADKGIDHAAKIIRKHDRELA